MGVVVFLFNQSTALAHMVPPRHGTAREHAPCTVIVVLVNEAGLSRWCGGRTALPDDREVGGGETRP